MMAAAGAGSLSHTRIKLDGSLFASAEEHRAASKTSFFQLLPTQPKQAIPSVWKGNCSFPSRTPPERMLLLDLVHTPKRVLCKLLSASDLRN